MELLSGETLEKLTVYRYSLSKINLFVWLHPMMVFLNYLVNYQLHAYSVVVSMFDFHHSDRGLNPGRGGKISCLQLYYRASPLASV